jgi:hypothetical protein
MMTYLRFGINLKHILLLKLSVVANSVIADDCTLYRRKYVVATYLVTVVNYIITLCTRPKISTGANSDIQKAEKSSEEHLRNCQLDVCLSKYHFYRQTEKNLALSTA